MGTLRYGSRGEGPHGTLRGTLQLRQSHPAPLLYPKQENLPKSRTSQLSYPANPPRGEINPPLNAQDKPAS